MHAHLDRDVTVAGVGSSVELWSTAAFEQAQQYTLQNLDPMRASVAGRAK
jgi:DNA-binding transcriptional regulator/RsmH inhibitor MraZ